MITQQVMDEATAVLRKEWFDCAEGKGSHCPVCNRWGKYNHVKLNKTMVMSLAWLCNTYRNRGNKYVHVPSEAPRFVTRSYAITKLKHWNLVCPMESPAKPSVSEALELEPDKTRSSGMWAPTPFAYDFLYGRVALPEAVFVYDDTRVGASDKQIYVQECMDNTFNYSEMMSQTFDGGESWI